MAKADTTSSDLVLGLLAVCPKCEIRLEKKERSWTQIQKAVLYLYLYFLEANYIYTGSEEIIQNHPGGGGGTEGHPHRWRQLHGRLKPQLWCGDQPSPYPWEISLQATANGDSVRTLPSLQSHGMGHNMQVGQGG